MASPTTGRQVNRDPDEAANIDDLISEVIPDPAVWKRTPNPVLGGRKPEEFIGQPDEGQLRDLLRAGKHGFFS